MLARPDLFEPVELGRRAFLKVTLPAGEHPVTLPVAEHEPAHQNDELDMLRAALADEADRYRSLFESVPVALVTTDATGIIRHANAAAGQLLDIEPRFLLGTPLSLYADAHERAELRSLTRQLTATGGTSGDTRIRLRRRSGVALDLLVRATASLSEIRWVLQDVADEQQAEQRLWGLNRELEARVTEQAGEIEAVLEQLPVGVAIVDAETRAVRRMNARAQEIVGESLLRDAGDGLVALEPTNADGTPIDPGDLPARQALGGETTTRRTISVRVADGRRALLEVHATPIRGARGDVRAAVLTFDDVTERERREQADREFVSNAAHQLRTPLTAIASAVAALQTGAKNVPEERDRFLAHLERETDRLARLGRALLTLARAQRGESAPDIRVVRLRPLLEALAEWASRRAGVEIVVSCPANVGALANPELLEEALANVVANAVAHTDRGRVVLSAAAQDGTTIVEVADSGTGITPEEQPRVFERFYRASKSGPTGFGLGLPIAKAALEAMHGSIDIRSAVNEGTTIRICVPSARILR
jgi:PAS domain S-box-containing protein